MKNIRTNSHNKDVNIKTHINSNNSGNTNNSLHETLNTIPKKLDNFSQVLTSVKRKLKGTENIETKINGLRDICSLAETDFKVLTQSDLPQLSIRLISDSLSNFKVTNIIITCRAAKAIFPALTFIPRPEFDEIIDKLLSRTADINRIIRTEANAALDTAVQSVPVQYIVQAITQKAINHKNYLVRFTVTRLLYLILECVGVDNLINLPILAKTRRYILTTACTLLDDSNTDVRLMVRKLLKLMMDHAGDFDLLLAENIDNDLIKKIDRSLCIFRYVNKN